MSQSQKNLTGLLVAMALSLATPARAQATAPEPSMSSSSGTSSAPAKAAGSSASSDKAPVVLDKVEVVTDRLAGIGSVVLTREEILSRTGAEADMNKLFQTSPNVQFSTNDGRVTNAEIVDLRPSLISIAGGRPYDNSFLIDGIGTNSLHDSTNQNIHDTTEIVGHPQTAVINPLLLESVALFSSDIPAEYGGFTGGVVSARIRDPLNHWSGGVALGYSSSEWSRYHIADAQISASNPNPPVFERRNLDVHLDVPLGQKTAALVAWSRNEALLKNTQRFATFGIFDAKTRTMSDNVLAKVAHKLNDNATVRLTSIYAPYATENREQDLKTTYNSSWTNKAELVWRTDRSSLETGVGAIFADNSREGLPNLYTYRNFGAGYQTPWVASSQTVALRGGYGELESTQVDIPLNLKYTFKATETGEFSAGADYIYSEARRRHDKESAAYRHTTTVGLVANPLVISGDGPDDPSVISGEQGLTYRLLFPAYDAKVAMQTGDVWAQWKDRGKWQGIPWSYRAGIRADTNDFTRNTDFAPRFTPTASPISLLTLRVGVNRYYNDTLAAYKIREKTPSNSAYTRTGRSENGRLVFYAADWRPTALSVTRYNMGDLNTPYCDELSGGLTFNLGHLGTLEVIGLQRRYRDEFSRSAASVAVIGGVNTTSYVMTNEGFTNYNSVSFEWRKTWRNHAFAVGGTRSRTETTTVTYFDEYDESLADDPVYYNGAIFRRDEIFLVRANFARPSYLNYSWTSTWFNRRLQATVFGRWNEGYSRTQLSGTAQFQGGSYPRYLDTRFGATFINNVNLAWTFWQNRLGSITLETKISNMLDRLPNAEGVTPAAPYQEGRSFWTGLRYAY